MSKKLRLPQSPPALEPGSVSLILLAGGVGKRMGVRRSLPCSSDCFKSSICLPGICLHVAHCC